MSFPAIQASSGGIPPLSAGPALEPGRSRPDGYPVHRVGEIGQTPPVVVAGLLRAAMFRLCRDESRQGKGILHRLRFITCLKTAILEGICSVETFFKRFRWW
jgi:hypothetical protein